MLWISGLTSFNQFIFHTDTVIIYFLFRFSEITVKLNKPPVGGTCQLTYSDTVALISNFNIACDNNWVDPEEIGMGVNIYLLYLNKDDGSKLKSTLAATRRKTLDIVLPVGKYDVCVDVCDILESCTQVCLGTIETTMPTKEQLEAMNIDELLKKLAESGDSSTYSMFMKAHNSILAEAEWNSLTPESTANMTEEQIDALLLERANRSADAIGNVQNSGPATSLSQVNMNMEVVSSTLSGLDQSTITSYAIDIDTRENAIEVIKTMTKNVEELNVPSTEELKPFMRGALSSITSLMISSNNVLKNGNKAPPRDMLYAPFKDYDTDIGDNLDLVVPTENKDILTNSVMLQSQRVFKEHVEEMLEVIRDISRVLLGKMVKGETISTKTDSGASMLVASLGEEMLINGMTIKSPEEQRAKSIFPKKFCPSKRYNPYSICRTNFGITMIVWPCITHYYSATTHFLSYASRIMQAEVTLEGKLAIVDGQKDPILFEIPRDPETLPQPLTANVTSNMNDHIPLVYHYFNLSIPMGAYTIEITPSVVDVRMILLIAHKSYPTPTNYLKAYNISELPLNNGTHVLFVNTVGNANRTGQFIAGVGLLKKPLANTNFTKDDLDKTFDADYQFRILVSACYFFNASTSLWSGAGLAVVKAEHFLTTCSTPHLTGFGTGFLPAPNTVDFDFIIANMGFVDNSTLYAVLILFFALYLIMMLWSRFKDRRDSERLGVIPFPDNKPEDKYIYEITCYTGPDAEAACESSIFLVASGDYGETQARSFPDPTPNLYRRYDRNTFVMTTSHPLGHLRYLRIYHDNNGRPPYDSWQLERVVVRDLQMREIYSFEANCFLSLSHDDGLIDRTFSSYEEGDAENGFSKNMYYQSNRSANQDHIWLSMFLRPIGSRFSRKERVTVGAVLLFLSMLINALWYNFTAESGVDAFIYIGPIPITPDLFLTGFFVLLIVYPIVMVLIMVFKRARPRNLKRCRALDAIEEQRNEQLSEKGFDEFLAEAHSKVSINENETGSLTKDKPVVKCLPWWTRILAWIFSLAAIAVSAFFIWSYAIMWGNIRTIKWFASFFASFAISLILTQWLKVVFGAFCASVTSNTRLITEDVDCDEELPQLKSDETWKNMKELDADATRKVHRMKGIESDEERTSRLRVQLRKNREMAGVMRGIMMYCVFLVVLLIIVNDRADYNGSLMKRHLVNTFLKPGIQTLDVKNVSQIND